MKAENRTVRISESISKDLERAKTNPIGLNDAFGHARKLLGFQCVVDPTAQEPVTWERTILVNHIATAVFQAAKSTTENFECRIGREEYTFPASGATYYSSCSNWQVALWCAMICHDKQRIETLVEIPNSVLMTEEVDDYVPYWINSLKSYWTTGRSGQFPRYLNEAAQRADPDQISQSHPDYVNFILVPTMRLMARLGSGNVDAFNEALESAISMHKEFWSHPDNMNNPLGFIALGPLAVAAVAHTVGFTISVESDYLPKYLVKGTWID
ncbi:immunity 49 family protein [Actinopolyspora mortivallis]|uniref:immunity 49 family protein n=1 Tax=Actinopolyspora mortivallis TaxID=33906 RepID=UPI0015E5F43D|nr:immunity 49 family protein [Actinopolyspora mortivallis]